MKEATQILAEIVAVARDPKRAEAVLKLGEREAKIAQDLESINEVGKRAAEDRAHATAQRGEAMRLHTEINNELKPKLEQTAKAYEFQLQRDREHKERVEAFEVYARQIKDREASLAGKAQELSELAESLAERERIIKRREDAYAKRLQAAQALAHEDDAA